MTALRIPPTGTAVGIALLGHRRISRAPAGSS